VDWLMAHAASPIRYRALTEVVRLSPGETAQVSNLPFTHPPALLGRGGRCTLCAGDRGACGEESDAERRDAECLHGAIPRVMDGRTKD